MEKIIEVLCNLSGNKVPVTKENIKAMKRYYASSADIYEEDIEIIEEKRTKAIKEFNRFKILNEEAPEIIREKFFETSALFDEFDKQELEDRNEIARYRLVVKILENLEKLEGWE